jgi:hypothetical protein
VRGFEARGAKEFTMSIQDAKDMHADITRMLIDLQTLRENAVAQAQEPEVVTVQMDGGTF